VASSRAEDGGAQTLPPDPSLIITSSKLPQDQPASPKKHASHRQGITPALHEGKLRKRPDFEYLVNWRPLGLFWAWLD